MARTESRRRRDDDDEDDRRVKRSGKKKGFAYHERSASDVKRRAERKGGGFDSIFKSGFDTWTPKAGTNVVRILPPTWEDHDHYGYTVWVHNRIGADSSTYLCPRKMKQKNCPICNAAKEAQSEGEADEAKALKATERVVCWIIDRDEESETPLLWSCSWTQDRDINALLYNDRSGKVILIDHPDEGYDLTLKRSGSGLKTKYFGYAVDRDSTPIDDDSEKQDEILKYITDTPIPDTLNFYDEDYLEKAISGTSEREDEDLDEDEDDKKSRRRRKDEDDDETSGERDDRRGGGRRRRDEDDDEEEEKEKPRRRKGEEEDEDEEDNKRERPSRRERRHSRDDEDEEDDKKKDRKSRKDDDEEEGNEDDTGEEEEERPSRRSRRGRDEEEESSEDDEEDERPSRRRSRRR